MNARKYITTHVYPVSINQAVGKGVRIIQVRLDQINLLVVQFFEQEIGPINQKRHLSGSGYKPYRRLGLISACAYKSE